MPEFGIDVVFFLLHVQFSSPILCEYVCFMTIMVSDSINSVHFLPLCGNTISVSVEAGRKTTIDQGSLK